MIIWTTPAIQTPRDFDIVLVLIDGSPRLAHRSKEGQWYANGYKIDAPDYWAEITFPVETTPHD